MKILIIEDEQEIVDFLRAGLEAERFAVDFETDGEAGIYAAKTNSYDLIIADNMLPKGSGIEVCRTLRSSGINVPIIMLSVISDSVTKTDLLNAGADDYMTKPFSFDELLARLRALLRRPLDIQSETLKIDDLTLNTARHTVSRGGDRLRLTPKEFSLLEYLLRNRGNVLSRSMILEHVWDMNADPFSNTIEAHIRSLRKKVDTEGRRKLIHTVHGLGYKVDTAL